MWIWLLALSAAAEPSTQAILELGAWDKALDLRTSNSGDRSDKLSHSVAVCHQSPPAVNDALFFMPAMHQICTAKSVSFANGEAAFAATCRIAGNRTLDLEGRGPASSRKYDLKVDATVTDGGKIVQYKGRVYGRRTASCSVP
jgi:hypothetical protein